ncbi:hypothetical protein F4777DRAFT_539487 [Nemania sp. FL0916]|nr:hypothetical protein F4777DRAFT_539487 [Nemania sp. FL0916]
MVVEQHVPKRAPPGEAAANSCRSKDWGCFLTATTIVDDRFANDSDPVAPAISAIRPLHDTSSDSPAPHHSNSQIKIRGMEQHLGAVWGPIAYEHDLQIGAGTSAAKEQGEEQAGISNDAKIEALVGQNSSTTHSIVRDLPESRENNAALNSVGNLEHAGIIVEPDHASHWDSVAEDSAWETIGDEDQASEQSWETTDDTLQRPLGDAQPHETQNILSEIPGVVRQHSTSGSEIPDSHDEKATHDFAGSSSPLHETSHADLMHTRGLPEAEIPYEMQHLDTLEMPRQQLPLHQFVHETALDNHEIQLDHRQKGALEDASIQVAPGERQGQSMDEFATVRGQPELAASFLQDHLARSGAAPFRQLQHFEPKSNEYDGELTVEELGAAEPVHRFKHPFFSTPDNHAAQAFKESHLQAAPQQSPVEELIVPVGLAQDDGSTGLLDREVVQTASTSRNTSQEQLAALEEGYGDTEEKTHRLSRVFDYSRFAAEDTAFHHSHKTRDISSDEESEIVATTQAQKLNVGHMDRENNSAQGATYSQHDSHHEYNWPLTSSGSMDKPEQVSFEPLLDDGHLGNIGFAYAPARELAATQLQDQTPEDTNIPNLEPEVLSYPAEQKVYVRPESYGNMPDISTSETTAGIDHAYALAAGESLHNLVPAAETAGADITPAGSIPLAHIFVPKNEIGENIFPSSRELRRSNSDVSSEDSGLLEGLPVVPMSTTQRVEFVPHKESSSTKTGLSVDRGNRDRMLHFDPISSRLSGYSEFLHSDVDRTVPVPSLETRSSLPRRSGHVYQPTLVHSSTQTDEGLIQLPSSGPASKTTEELRPSTPAIVLPDLNNYEAQTLGIMRSIKKKREQHYREIEEAVATAVIIRATAQELEFSPRPRYRDDRFDRNVVVSWSGDQGSVQMSSDNSSSEMLAEYSTEENELSPAIADLSTDDDGRDRRHHRHGSHRSNQHSSRSKDSVSGDDYRNRSHRRHRSKDDSNTSLKTGSDRSVSSRFERGEPRPQEGHHENSHGSSHRKHRTPEEREKRREYRARREQEGLAERERAREDKGKSAKPPSPSDDRHSPRSPKKSSERHVTIQEDHSPASSRKLFDWRRGKSTLEGVGDSPKRTSPPVSRSRPYQGDDEVPRPRSSRRSEELREESSKRHRERDPGQDPGQDPGRDRERQRDRERERDRNRDRTRDRERDKDRVRDRERDKEQDRDRDPGRNRDLEREQERERERAYRRERERDRDREQTRDRDQAREQREQKRERERERDRDRDRDRDREREQRHQERNRERDRERSSRPKVEENPKFSTRSMPENEGRVSTQSKFDNNAQSSSSSHKLRSTDVKDIPQRHGTTKREERQQQREREAEKKGSTGLRAAFKRFFN